MAAPRKYPDELRQRAVRLYRESDQKPVIRRLAEQLGVHHEALRNWIRQAGRLDEIFRQKGSDSCRDRGRAGWTMLTPDDRHLIFAAAPDAQGHSGQSRLDIPSHIYRLCTPLMLERRPNCRCSTSQRDRLPGSSARGLEPDAAPVIVRIGARRGTSAMTPHDGVVQVNVGDAAGQPVASEPGCRISSE